MNIETLTSTYFIGAGGIGMSALIRYFLSKEKRVAGYDKTPSALTEELNKEGAEIHYEEDIRRIPDSCKDPTHTLIVYTPAVPESHSELTYFRSNGFTIMKRAQVLGEITRSSRALCVAGTHGKTTTSSMIAHLLKQSHVDCNAFLGGILKNYDSNLLLSEKSDLTVIEADEFDRSFHWLSPYMAVITSADPDHLDIYGTAEVYKESFNKFTSLICPGGVLVLRKGINITPRLQKNVRSYTYSGSDDGDFHAGNIRIENREILFDFIGPNITIKDIRLGVPMKINIENGIAAIAIAWLNGVTPDEIKQGMASFAGPKRRFDFQLKKENIVLIDDYAHHPGELKESILSIKELYNGKKLTGIFQPHLYSRTRDFADDFAASLSLLDELILLDIYPAREKPIPGVTSQIIFDKVKLKKKTLCKKEALYSILEKGSYEVVLMAGAGDIDRMIENVKQILDKK
ncbi:MAG: UDP-N-acetylmuramate--L-alanine ligase [Massilibacteroides sp.]|nr:UDP-N-acetylmuramate--L-alanine ligase [Massilibacteroides sp.]MDD3062018.1 UDP-N-acetylmuramate--L-alanine ligase [Massilibacteroides sp.]MDD4115647.1 UDP-N-acetylmuramate--L-alanine ligase [Massilibacteroides sp.]MDD4659265.1 UDP-N-acetylmuramate--L-alanine ligase [Massilibacteroides sp.]